ncbi:MAG: hypothetical protein KL787_04475 [Taibaiella sp.]|nr:hypothetical protein [Taibaiella sp.]
MLLRNIILTLFSLLLLNLYSCGQDNSLEQIEIKYPNGQIKIKGTTLNEKKQGVSRTFYENGNIESQNNWDNNIQTGRTLKWFENGYKKLEGQLENGQETGEWKYFDKLDGEYIYSVFYKNGKEVDFKFSSDKYKWRRLELPTLDFIIELPTFLMDSFYAENTYSAYWAMYPWFNKNEVEYYSIIRTHFPIDNNMLQNSIKELENGNLDFLDLLRNNSTNVSSIPNFNVDKFEIVKSQKININGRDAFELIFIFIDINVEFRTIVIPSGNNVQFVSAYFNKDVSQENRDRYFNSIDFKR